MRLVYYLLSADSEYNKNLAQLIMQLKQRIGYCQVCHNFSEDSICNICSDATRDASLLCVVTQPQDVLQLEKSQEYHGRYHVLKGCISPIDGLGPHEIGIPQFLSRIEQETFTEVIIATNPTAEGDTTAMYIAKLLNDKEITITRPSMGLPVGADLEYADRLTIARSLRHRTSVD